MRALAGASVSSRTFSPSTNLRQAGRAVEGFVAAVAENDDGRLEGKDVVLERLEAVGPRAEAGAGVAPNVVAAPAEVAEGDVAVGPAAGQGRLPVAVALFAFDQRGADEDDAVAVLQLERFGGESGRRENGQPAKSGGKA